MVRASVALNPSTPVRALKVLAREREREVLVSGRLEPVDTPAILKALAKKGT